MNRFRIFIVSMGLLFAQHAAAQDAAKESAGDPAIPVLEIEITATGLSGPGAELIRTRLKDTQFVALGEDHGFADAPLLARALNAEWSKTGSAVHVAEIGPETAKLVRAALAQDGVDGVRTLLNGNELAIPFVSNREDAELAADFIKPNGGVDLWGIDQEFIGAPMLLLPVLQRLAPDGEANRLVADLLEVERNVVANADQSKLLMLSAPPKLFEELRAHFKGNEEATGIIDALDQSATIYRYNSEKKYFANNYVRIELMKRQFLDQYHQASAKPRALFKFGIFHMGKGTSPTKMFDMGSLLAGVAAAEQKKVLYIAFGAMGGRQVAFQPSKDGYTTVKSVDDKIIGPLLSAAGIDLSRIVGSGHYLVPTAAIRERLESKGLNELSRFARFIVLGFDFIVTTRDAKPATPLTRE